MNVYEALEAMRQGRPVKTKNGLLGNSTSVFTVNSISIIFERFTDNRQKQEQMLSIRHFIKLGKNLEFYEA